MASAKMNYVIKTIFSKMYEAKDIGLPAEFHAIAEQTCLPSTGRLFAGSVGCGDCGCRFQRRVFIPRKGWSTLRECPICSSFLSFIPQMMSTTEFPFCETEIAGSFPLDEKMCQYIGLSDLSLGVNKVDSLKDVASFNKIDEKWHCTFSYRGQKMTAKNWSQKYDGIALHEDRMGNEFYYERGDLIAVGLSGDCSSFETWERDEISEVQLICLRNIFAINDFTLIKKSTYLVIDIYKSDVDKYMRSNVIRYTAFPEVEKVIVAYRNLSLTNNPPNLIDILLNMVKDITYKRILNPNITFLTGGYISPNITTVSIRSSVYDGSEGSSSKKIGKQKKKRK